MKALNDKATLGEDVTGDKRAHTDGISRIPFDVVLYINVRTGEDKFSPICSGKVATNWRTAELI